MGRAKKQLQGKEPVNIRYKEGKSGMRSIYLDCYVKGKRWYEFLSKEIGYLYPENTTDYREKAHNAEVEQRARAIRAQRISEIYAGKDSAQKVAQNGKMLLQDWMEIIAQKHIESGHKNDRIISYTKRILLEYAGANVQMQDIDKKFCLGFLQFIKHLRVNKVHKDIISMGANSEINPKLNREHFVVTRNRDIVKKYGRYWEKITASKERLEVYNNAYANDPEKALFFATHTAVSRYEAESKKHKVREATASDMAKAEATFIKPNTQASYYRCFSAALNAAVRAEIIQSNPFDKIDKAEKITTPDSAREYLTIDELKQLIATECKREDIKRAFLFSCFCGLRISDISAITWGQISQDGEQMRIQLQMQKTKEPLYLPISAQAQKYMPQRGTASAGDNIFHIPNDAICNSKIAEWAKAARITKKVTFHVARHTFATMMLTLGADLYTTSKLLGHTNIDTTQIYAKIVNKKKDEAVNLTNGIF